MTTELKIMMMAPLNGNNYATWKIQCKMALMEDGLWSIVNGDEILPQNEVERRKFVVQRDRALAIIVLSVEPLLLYLLGDPQDLAVDWQKLCDQFQKKTWANKLTLRRKLL